MRMTSDAQFTGSSAFTLCVSSYDDGHVMLSTQYRPTEATDLNRDEAIELRDWLIQHIQETA